MSQRETIALHKPTVAVSCFCSAQQNRSKGVRLSRDVVSAGISCGQLVENEYLSKPPEREFLLLRMGGFVITEIEAKAKQIRRATRRRRDSE